MIAFHKMEGYSTEEKDLLIKAIASQPKVLKMLLEGYQIIRIDEMAQARTYHVFFYGEEKSLQTMIIQTGPLL